MNRQLPALQAAALLVAATAQESAREDDVGTVDGIIRAYYEVVSGPAGEVADIDRDRTLHHPEAWIVRTGCEQHHAVPRRRTLVDHGLDVRRVGSMTGRNRMTRCATN